MAILDDHVSRAARVLPRPALFVGGEPVEAASGATMDHTDPSTGKTLAQFPVAGEPEVDRAVAAGWAAFPAWKRMPADERRRLLFRIAGLIRSQEAEILQILALESGGPVSVNKLRLACDQFEYYAGWTDKFEGELVATYPRRAFSYVRYEPYGVVAAFSTWNSPVNNAAMKLAPALAAGNCVVLKSSELAPFSLMRLAEICSSAGLPDGVLSVLAGGPATAQAIIGHPDVRKISFTGGPSTARKIMAAAAHGLKPVTMELGGKSANIIFADADLEQASQMAGFMSTIATAGQGCFYPTRLFVQDCVYDEVLARVASVASSPVIGDPLQPATTMGPVIGQDAVDRILSYVQAAKSGPARLICGGDRLGGELADGFFLAPTIFADVEHDSPLAQEEVFGPVLAVMPFGTEEEVIAKANATRYGLAAYLHTADISRAFRVADELDAGMVSINAFPSVTASAPFGGVKESGFGSEGGRAGIEEFTHPKNVFIPVG